MKQILFIVSFILTVAANAQIFDSKYVLNKFDEKTLDLKVKTLISKDDSSITIEEKGKSPMTYQIIKEWSYGSEDTIINLIDNVYGYETTYVVTLNDYKYFITHRVVTTQYSHTKLSEFYWIMILNSQERTVYHRDLR